MDEKEVILKGGKEGGGKEGRAKREIVREKQGGREGFTLSHLQSVRRRKEGRREKRKNQSLLLLHLLLFVTSVTGG